MAARYWVGGSASWDATAGTKWALTSGGAGGQAVPTNADDVFFDATSGAVTITQSGARVCLSLTCTGFTGTFAGSGGLTISGTLLAVAGMTWSNTSTITFDGTGNITCAGKLGSVSVTINGNGTTTTLQDAFACSILTLTRGTLLANNQTVAPSSGFVTAGVLTRALTLGTGLWTVGGSWNVSGSGFTITVTGSTIKMTSASGSFIGGDKTYNNVSLAPTANTSAIAVSGNNTFADLKFDLAANSLTFMAVIMSGTQTVTTFTVAGTSAGHLLNLYPPTGATWTISCTSGTIAVDYVSLYKGTASGGATFNAANSNDLGGNSGWNITAPSASAGMLVHPGMNGRLAA